MASQDSSSFRLHYDALNDKNFELRGPALLVLIIVFAICLLLTLLCLYAKWMCRHRQLMAAPGSEPPQLHLPASHSVGLDPLTISGLPVHFYRSRGGEAQCCICLSSFQEEEKVKVLPDCHHLFHSECVDLWLKNHSSCPLCRASINSSNKRESEAHELA